MLHFHPSGGPTSLVRHEFLKPTIWVSPSRVVALGRNVTIRCEGQDLGMEFVLCKAGHPNQQVQSVVPEGKMAEFPIASVGQEDGGSYTCYYRSITDQSHWSFPSNPVEIIVGGEGGAWLSGPAPSPTPRQTHRGSLQGVRFVLNKEGRHFPPVDSDGFGAVFPISNVSREDGGNYSCSYHSRSEPFAVSDPSDPMELVVRGEGYPKPNISGIPRRGVSVGEAMAIWCRRQRQGVRFVLNKEGRHFPPVDSDGFGAVFPISNVSREDGGNYSCSYHSRSEPFAVSDPSDPMELVVRGCWEGLMGSITESPGDALELLPTKPVRTLGSLLSLGEDCLQGKKLTRLHLLGLTLEHSASSAPPCASHSEPTPAGSWGSQRVLCPHFTVKRDSQPASKTEVYSMTGTRSKPELVGTENRTPQLGPFWGAVSQTLMPALHSSSPASSRLTHPPTPPALGFVSFPGQEIT
uniref:Ig-like domain-containing protein n=1 Tax=Gopherus agassizii TaxID=38772 RepID=A0A452J274_9SAUR